MSRQPSLSPQGGLNVYDTENFDVVATFGSSSLASYSGREVKLARTETGELTLTLPQTYRHVTRFSASWLLASGTPLVAVIKADTVKTDGKLVIETRSGGTPTDAASGAKLFLSLAVSRSFLNDQHAALVP